MFQRKRRKFRYRQNGRDRSSHENGYMQVRPRSNSFPSIQTRNNFRPTQSAEKLFEKYNTLAKEAMSSGDKTLGANYLKHPDHFVRIIEDKNKNRDQSQDNIIGKTKAAENSPSKDINIKQEDVTKDKE